MSEKSKQKIVVGISGGVDSAVTAALLQAEGYHIIPVFMHNWDENDKDCPLTDDLKDAEQACHILNLKLHVVKFAKEYWDKVFEKFLDDLASGLTPNPDVLCNQEIKFNTFWKYADSLDADYIATGHYARISSTSQRTNKQLIRAVDRNKDQTYFLCRLSQENINRSLFPIGNYLKPEVRKLAKKFGFNNFNKRDSTGICFVGEKKFRPFLNQYLLDKPGNIYSIDGKLIGKHRGVFYYTIGQRQGLDIGGMPGIDDPWYVVDKCIKKNTLVVAPGKDHPALFAHALITDDFNWINQPPTQFPIQCHAQIRYRQYEVPCTVEQTPRKNQLAITFPQPVKAITPGQYVVLYNKSQCLGGGVITNYSSDYKPE